MANYFFGISEKYFLSIPFSSAYSQMVITGNSFANIEMISRVAKKENSIIITSILVGE